MPVPVTPAVARPLVSPEVLPISVPIGPIVAGLMAGRTVQSSVMSGVMTTIMTLYRLPAIQLVMALIVVVMAPRMVPVLLHGAADGRPEQEIGRVVIVGRGDRARHSECQRQGAQCECACH